MFLYTSFSMSAITARRSFVWLRLQNAYLSYSFASLRGLPGMLTILASSPRSWTPVEPLHPCLLVCGLLPAAMKTASASAPRLVPAIGGTLPGSVFHQPIYLATNRRTSIYNGYLYFFLYNYIQTFILVVCPIF